MTPIYIAQSWTILYKTKIFAEYVSVHEKGITTLGKTPIVKSSPPVKDFLRIRLIDRSGVQEIQQLFYDIIEAVISWYNDAFCNGILIETHEFMLGTFNNPNSLLIGEDVFVTIPDISENRLISKHFKGNYSEVKKTQKRF